MAGEGALIPGDGLERLGEPEWQQLYVNAEHDGQVGVISLSRESYNSDVDIELNRAIDWLKAAKIDRVILSSDFHLSTQMVGADTSEFDRMEEGGGRGWPDDQVNVEMDVSATVEEKWEGLNCHRTQFGPGNLPILI